jgi:UDP-N-acetylmuramoyl-tripeptide--D-alanyl-D-alanine ligase
VANVLDGVDGLLVSSRGPRDLVFERGSIDSRETRDGDLFFALRGERTDGHDFVPQALAAGATGAVVERPLEIPQDRCEFHVSDSLAALQRLAAYWRRRQDVRTVGVTGSVGKTTAKELIASVLATRYTVLKSEANLNTEIGIPLTLLQLRPKHRHAVLEMAMYARGDIALLARIAAPQIGIVMNVGPVHLERLGSIGAITSAKAELVETLPADGLAVLNGDDPRVSGFANRTKARAVLFGATPQCEIRAEQVETHGLDGISFTLVTPDGQTRVTCPLPGRHHVYAALAAAAVGLHEGLTLDQLASGIAQARADLRLTQRRGPNSSTIIDDSYNASPASMLAALDLLGECRGRRIALLGGMRELGAATAEGNLAVGERAASRCDLLLVIGEEAREIGEAARRGGLNDVRFLASPERAAETLLKELAGGDYILIKASRAVGLESVVEALVSA